MQLCVGDEFLFHLAKPSRSFQNLTGTPPRKGVLLSSFCCPKSRKWPYKIENRLTKKAFTPKNDLDYKGFHCEMLARDLTIFAGKKFLLCFLIILNAAT